MQPGSEDIRITDSIATIIKLKDNTLAAGILIVNKIVHLGISKLSIDMESLNETKIIGSILKLRVDKTNEIAVFDSLYGEEITRNGAFCLPLKGDLIMIDHEELLCFASKNIKNSVEYFNLLLEKKSDLVRSIKQAVNSAYDSLYSLECFKLDIGADSNQEDMISCTICNKNV